MTSAQRIELAQRLDNLIGGDPLTEALVLRYIHDRWQARTLLMLPLKVAFAILARPTDFLAKVKAHIIVDSDTLP